MGIQSRQRIRASNIPGELRARQRWVVWGAARRSGLRSKVPYGPLTGQQASVNAPSTWSTFDQALTAALEWASGIAFVLTPDDPYVGWDLDRCRDATTEVIASWAAQIVARMRSYTEISPSGSGLRIIVRAALPAHGRKRGLIEVYDACRALSMTGDRLQGTPRRIASRCDDVVALHTEMFPLRHCPRSSLLSSLCSSTIRS